MRQNLNSGKGASLAHIKPTIVTLLIGEPLCAVQESCFPFQPCVHSPFSLVLHQDHHGPLTDTHKSCELLDSWPLVHQECLVIPEFLDCRTFSQSLSSVCHIAGLETDAHCGSFGIPSHIKRLKKQKIHKNNSVQILDMKTGSTDEAEPRRRV